MRLAPDSSPKFIVKCSAYVAAGEDAPPRPCEMLGYYGAWPLFLWVMSDRAAKWDATFERVREYLARHTVSRID
jgi:hypothetical protein